TANVMLLTDDDEANDTDAWLAFTLTGIGLVPVVGSAVKGVGKVILKNTGESLSAALAVLRKLGKGDPVKYLRDINWQDLGKQSATEVKNIVKSLRDSLNDMSTSWHYDLLLPDAAIAGMQATVKRLDEVTPKIDQHMQQAAQEIGQRVNKALDEYQGQSPIRGVTDKPTKAKADELEPPKGNELPGSNVVNRNTIIDPDSVNKINDLARKPKFTSDGKVIPFGGQPSDAITIRNKNNLDENGYLHRKGKKLQYDSNGFPIFESKFDTHISDHHIGSGKATEHFKEANKNLAIQLEKNPSLAKTLGLNDEQVAHIMKKPPSKDPADGLTWHHHQDTGRMQLIDRTTHDTFRHTGGMSIWGGGY
ncbi:hypothetical protein CBQ28_22095, partial [Pseudoalteromonas sp. GCY]